MKYLIYVVAAWSMFASARTEAQSFTQAEIDSVQFRIFNFMQRNEARSYDSSQSELLLVILETDSSSVIRSIHLLSDHKNRSVGYSILSKLDASDFKGWRPANFPGKSIIVPVYCNGNINADTNRYTVTAFGEMAWGGLTGRIMNSNSTSVILSGIYYIPPYSPRSIEK